MNARMTKRRAAIYARQSKTDDEGVDRQIERGKALIEARGWAHVATFIDNDVTASTPRGAKTAWGQMLASASGLDVVVSVDLDRILRSTRDLNTLIDHDLALITLDGEIDLSTADGEFRGTMLAAIARFEVRRKAERQKRANEARVASGRASTATRQRPFGYAATCRKGCDVEHQHDWVGLVVEPEAEVIRDAYAAAIGGSSMAAIAARWNEAGFRTSRHKAWTGGAVSLVLASPRYMGRVTYQREDAGPAAWDAIVDEPTWRAARSLLGIGKGKVGGYGATLLGKVAFCGVCDDGTHVRGGSNNGRRSYRCDGPVQHLSRAAADVEQHVAEEVVALLARGDVAELLAPAGEDMAPVIAEANDVRGRLDAVAIDYADGIMTRQQMVTATERLRSRLDALEARMAEASRGSEFSDLPEVADLLASASASVEDAERAWKALDLDRKRRLVDALFTVTLRPGTRGRTTYDRTTVTIVPRVRGALAAA